MLYHLINNGSAVLVVREVIPATYFGQNQHDGGAIELGFPLGWLSMALQLFIGGITALQPLGSRVSTPRSTSDI